jgi:branched-chain amino acid transport system ATP-binding protein
MLELRDVVAGYGKIPIISNINLIVRKGESISIIGPNGSGKSTVAKTIIGLTTLHSGTLLFDGIDITHVAPEKRVQKGIGYLPQTDNVFPDLTVLENLEMGGYDLGKGELEKRVRWVLEFFPELRERLRQKAGTLSGGERQMLAMARLLISSPKLAVLDEPSAGLSPKMVVRVYEKVDAMRKSGITLIIIEQNAVKALKHSTRAVVMVGGRILLTGHSHEVAVQDLRKIFFQLPSSTGVRM